MSRCSDTGRIYFATEVDVGDMPFNSSVERRADREARVSGACERTSEIPESAVAERAP